MCSNFFTRFSDLVFYTNINYVCELQSPFLLIQRLLFRTHVRNFQHILFKLSVDNNFINFNHSNYYISSSSEYVTSLSNTLLVSEISGKRYFAFILFNSFTLSNVRSFNDKMAFLFFFLLSII